MDQETFDLFVAYCRKHKITFHVHHDGATFRIDFSAENDEDIAELLKFLERRQDDKTIRE